MTNTQQATENRKRTMGVGERIYIRDMERKIMISIDGGYYDTATFQLRGLMDYIKEKEEYEYILWLCDHRVL